MRFLLTSGLCAIVGLSFIAGISGGAYAGNSVRLPADKETPLTTATEEPVTVRELASYEPSGDVDGVDDSMPLDIRMDALKEAAISFGARGGLAKRTYEIRKEMDTRARYLDSVYNFAQLLIAAPSGFMIEPPIITESMNAMIIKHDGQTAAVSDKIYNIIRNARIVSAPRIWRQYLEREWGEVMPPPDILTPRNSEERRVWKSHVHKGWKYGYQQADDIFKEDLARLDSDYQGMIRYKMLLAQGMVSPPYALQVDRGITGDGDEMHIGDRAVQITGVPELITGADTWKPASR
ncbi:MAG: type IV secretory system conjugative DNA transfer family protein [Alphaproteobacteria bacterium]|nr:type IV secretory system conjugative DNA transfer family protein [Alphaproteobacteria bacterium]